MAAVGGTYPVGKLFDTSPGHPAKHTFINASRDRENGHLRRAQKVPEAVVAPRNLRTLTPEATPSLQPVSKDVLDDALEAQGFIHL